MDACLEAGRLTSSGTLGASPSQKGFCHLLKPGIELGVRDLCGHILHGNFIGAERDYVLHALGECWGPVILDNRTISQLHRPGYLSVVMYRDAVYTGVWALGETVQQTKHVDEVSHCLGEFGIRAIGIDDAHANVLGPGVLGKKSLQKCQMEVELADAQALACCLETLELLRLELTLGGGIVEVRCNVTVEKLHLVGQVEVAKDDAETNNIHQNVVVRKEKVMFLCTVANEYELKCLALVEIPVAGGKALHLAVNLLLVPRLDMLELNRRRSYYTLHRLPIAEAGEETSAERFMVMHRGRERMAKASKAHRSLHLVAEYHVLEQATWAALGGVREVHFHRETGLSLPSVRIQPQFLSPVNKSTVILWTGVAPFGFGLVIRLKSLRLHNLGHQLLGRKSRYLLNGITTKDLDDGNISAELLEEPSADLDGDQRVDSQVNDRTRDVDAHRRTHRALVENGPRWEEQSARSEDPSSREAADQEAWARNMDDGSRETTSATLLDQAGHEKVGGVVVGLSNVTDDRSDRAQTNEEVELGVAKDVVEMLRAEDLGGEGVVQLLSIHIDEEAVLEHHGSVANTSNGRHGGFNLAHHSFNRLLLGQVHGHDLDGGADTTSFLESGFLKLGIATSDNYVLGSVADHPFTDRQTETTSHASHEVTHIRLEQSLRFQGLDSESDGITLGPVGDEVLSSKGSGISARKIGSRENLGFNDVANGSCLDTLLNECSLAQVGVAESGRNEASAKLIRLAVFWNRGSQRRSQSRDTVGAIHKDSSVTSFHSHILRIHSLADGTLRSIVHLIQLSVRDDTRNDGLTICGYLQLRLLSPQDLATHRRLLHLDQAQESLHGVHSGNSRAMLGRKAEQLHIEMRQFGWDYTGNALDETGARRMRLARCGDP
ncbi:hypothetical protein HG530_014661 [Fusarium avenaceum]|nr:hypothetical protein HG530_014661 [Fusarium avenaceum]